MGATWKDILGGIVWLTPIHHSKDRVTVIREGRNKEVATRQVPLWDRDTRGAQRIHRGRVSL